MHERVYSLREDDDEECDKKRFILPLSVRSFFQQLFITLVYFFSSYHHLNSFFFISHNDEDDDRVVKIWKLVREVFPPETEWKGKKR